MDYSGEEYRMLILPDHPTPIYLRTHTADPVPFLLYDSRRQARKIGVFSEKEAAASGNYQPNGHMLIEELIQR